MPFARSHKNDPCQSSVHQHIDGGPAPEQVQTPFAIQVVVQVRRGLLLLGQGLHGGPAVAAGGEAVALPARPRQLLPTQAQQLGLQGQTRVLLLCCAQDAWPIQRRQNTSKPTCTNLHNPGELPVDLRHLPVGLAGGRQVDPEAVAVGGRQGFSSSCHPGRDDFLLLVMALALVARVAQLPQGGTRQAPVQVTLALSRKIKRTDAFNQQMQQQQQTTI